MTISLFENSVKVSLASLATFVEETMQTGVATREAVIISAFLSESFSYATTLGGIISSKTKSFETPENS